jgi:surface antigen
MERMRRHGYSLGKGLRSNSKILAQLALLLCFVVALLIMATWESSARSTEVTQIRKTTSSVVRFSTGAGGGCHNSDVTVAVQPGDTLSAISARYGTSWFSLASYNHLSDPNLLFPGQTLCVPATHSSSPHPNTPEVGQANVYPYGQCTWWANQRYSQMHGIYVPWTTNSDAWEWTARAYDFGWQVSSTPQVGDIIDLQPWVQGASGLGHVAVVEQILTSGDVIASNMNWGSNPGAVVDVEFAPGPGVTFIRL